MRYCNILVTTLFLLVSFPASAEQSDDEARQRFVVGVGLYETGDYSAALAEFSAAYALHPHFSILFNMGQCYANLGRYDDAISHFERYLEEGRDQVPPESRSAAVNEIARLRSLFTDVMIRVNLNGATISIDGNDVGTAPLPGAIRISAGLHVIVARLEGHRSARREITVAGGSSLPPVDLELEAVRRTGRLSVASSSLGARVFVDDEDRGETPWEGELLVGEHDIQVRAPGYTTEQRTVAIAPEGETALEMDLEFAGLPAHLVVESTVSDSRVILGGRPLGDSPMSLSVPAGLHRLTVEHEGYLAWVGEVRLEEGQRATAMVDLQSLEDQGLSPLPFWAFLALTLSTGIASAAVGAVALSRQRELGRLLDELASEDIGDVNVENEAQEITRLQDSGRALAIYADALLITTGVFAIVDLILATLTQFSEPESEADIEIEGGVNGNSAWLGVEGRF